MSKDGETVTVSVVGEISEDTFAGVFRAKTRMSYGDTLTQDRVRRELLGEAGGTPSRRAALVAEMLSELYVRVLDAPSWWKNSAGPSGIPGMNLEDENVLVKVYNEVLKKDRAIAKALAAEAEQARKDLETTEVPKV
jgi:hypothetical protein